MFSIDNLIENYSSDFKEAIMPRDFRELLKNLSTKERVKIRGNTKLANAILDIIFPKIYDKNYYFWDNATLSLWEYLNKNTIIKKSTENISELGTGPYATLSLALKKRYPHLNIRATDISLNRVLKAKQTAKDNSIKIDIFSSDLLNNVSLNSDFIFMNPPYVSESHMSDISYNLKLTKEEKVSGYGGIHGYELIARLISQFKSKQFSRNTSLIISINNYFIPHNSFMNLLNKYNLKLKDKFKKQNLCTPDGPFVQVYNLQK